MVYFCLFFCVLYWRFTVPLTARLNERKRRFLRVAAATLLALPIVLNLAQWVLCGRFYVPELGETHFFLKMGFEMTILSLSFAVLLRDGTNALACLTLRAIKSKHALTDWARSSAVSIGVVCFAGVFLAGGIANGIAPPRVKQTTIVLPGLPKAFDGLKVVQLSDLHLYAFLGKAALEALVDRVNREAPDLVALTGDIADGAFEKRRETLRAFSNLKAPLGLWACEGNHEHYRDYAAYSAFYPTLGIRWLKNAHGVLERDGQKLVIAGLADLQAEAMGRELPDSAKAFKGVEALPAIVLFHQPTLARKVARRSNVLLMLSGHTHAGQVPGISFLARLRSRGFLAGPYAVRRGADSPMMLYVHAGTYLFPGFPLRWATAGEIAVLTLSRRP